MEARRLASTQQIELVDRARAWIAIVYIFRTVAGMQDTLTAGRTLRLAELGGASLEKQLTWGKATPTRASQQLAPESELCMGRSSFMGVAQQLQIASQPPTPSRQRGGRRRSALPPTRAYQPSNPRVGPTLFEKLRRAFYINSVFPQIKRMSHQPLLTTGTDWSGYASQVQAATITRQDVWKKWSIPLMCTVAVSRLKRLQRLRRAGKIVTSVLMQFTLTNNMFLGIKHRFAQVRQIQWAVRDWVNREAARHDHITELFGRIELGVIKRQWAEDDKKEINLGKKQLLKIRSVGERKAVSSVVELAKERYRRYMSPKTPFDLSHTQDLLNAARTPLLVRNLCTYHIYLTRKRLIKRELAEHAEKFEEYMRDLQMWNDIHCAVKILNPTSHNPDPVPHAPKHRSFVFTVEEGIALSIALALSRWCSMNQELLRVLSLQKKLPTSASSSENRSPANKPRVKDCPDASARPLGRFDMMEFMSRMPTEDCESDLSAEHAQVSLAVAEIVSAVMMD